MPYRTRLSILGLGIWCFLASGCQHLFYQPSSEQLYTPRLLGLTFEEVRFASKDNTSLHGWWIPAQPGPARATVIHYHGNAGNLSHFYLHVGFLSQQGYNVFVFDYRGYGKSEGEPSLEGLAQDARAALTYVRQRTKTELMPLVIFGQSLGGAIALSLMGNVERGDVAAIIVEGTFYSYQEIAASKLEKIWLTRWGHQLLSRWLFSDAQAPSHVLSSALAPTPLLVIHGLQDEVVPPEQGQKVFAAAQTPKWLWLIPQGRHIQMLSKFREDYRPCLLEFLDERLQAHRQSTAPPVPAEAPKRPAEACQELTKPPGLSAAQEILH